MAALESGGMGGECTHQILAGTILPNLGGEYTHQRVTVLPKLGEAMLPEMHALPNS